MNFIKFKSEPTTNNKEIKKLTFQPNSTISATNLPPHFAESDISSLFGHYGRVEKVQRLSDVGSFLVTFADLAIASALVQMARFNQFTLGSFQISLDYAPRTVTTTTTNTTTNTTTVISMVISNVKYPITVDIIKQICEKFGRILRIHIGKKNVNNIIESLVEFENNSEAKLAKEKLHGEDIYSGCCSLDIKMSSILSITVLKNDEQTWDFTKNVSKPGILQLPTQPSNTSMTPVNVESYNNSYSIWPFSNVPPPIYTAYAPPVSQVPQFSYPPIESSAVYNYNAIPSKVKVEISKDAFLLEPGVVFMCYHVPYNVSVDHLFNIFCLYGNVNKIRFLVNQPQTVMVQMGSRKSADHCIRHYNGMNLFSKEVKLSPCIKLEVFVPKNIDFLSNGTPSFKDYSKDANNRFLNDLTVANNKMYEPNRTLHFFNAPSSFREDDLMNMLLQSGVPKPLSIIIFNTKNDNIKKCIGLFEFHRLDDAIVALSVLNHKPIIIPDTNQTYHLKLTFSAREPNKVGSTRFETKRTCSNDFENDYQLTEYKKMKHETVVLSDEENEASSNTNEFALDDESKLLKNNCVMSSIISNYNNYLVTKNESENVGTEEIDNCQGEILPEKNDTSHLKDQLDEFSIEKNDEYELSLEFDEVQDLVLCNNVIQKSQTDDDIFSNNNSDVEITSNANKDAFNGDNIVKNNKSDVEINNGINVEGYQFKIFSDTFIDSSIQINTNSDVIKEIKDDDITSKIGNCNKYNNNFNNEIIKIESGNSNSDKVEHIQEGIKGDSSVTTTGVTNGKYLSEGN